MRLKRRKPRRPNFATMRRAPFRQYAFESTAWRRPPTIYSDEDDEVRHATWLELFFDLVFVVAIAEVGGLFHEELALSGFVGRRTRPSTRRLAAEITRGRSGRGS